MVAGRRREWGFVFVGDNRVLFVVVVCVPAFFSSFCLLFAIVS